MTILKTGRWYTCNVPEGKSGPWKVTKFELTKEDLAHDFLQEMREVRDVGESRRAVPGTYTKLTRNGEIVMTDTPAELNDLRGFEGCAEGSVLVHGLGLGIAVELALQKKTVKHLTVIELSADVIGLVAPTLTAKWPKDRLTIQQGDAYEFKPNGVKYDVVWSDIWDNICTDNIEGMKTLKKLWRRHAAWHGFWCERQCLFAARRRGW